MRSLSKGKRWRSLSSSLLLENQDLSFNDVSCNAITKVYAKPSSYHSWKSDQESFFGDNLNISIYDFQKVQLCWTWQVAIKKKGNLH